MKIIHNNHKKRFSFLEKGEEIGYLTYEYPDDESGKRNIDVLYLYVKPAYRRKGIAAKLLNYALKKFKRMTWVSLWTGKDAEIDKSYPLYRKVGFHQIAYQADYYKKGVGTRLFVRKML